MDLLLFCYSTDYCTIRAPNVRGDARGRVRLWGRTPDGAAVVVYVDDFYARFSIAPAPADPDPARLYAVLDDAARCCGARVDAQPRPVFPLHGYVEEPLSAWDVRAPWPALRFLFDGLQQRWRAARGPNYDPLVMGHQPRQHVAFHESTGTSPGTWIRVRGAAPCREGRARPGVAEWCAPTAGVGPAGGEYESAPPRVTVAYLAIETVAAEGAARVPDPARPEDRVVLISIVLAELGGDGSPRRRQVGVAGACAPPIPDCEVVAFTQSDADVAEAALLEWFVNAASEADVLVGFNSSGRDLPFLARRSEHLFGRGAAARDWFRHLGKDACPSPLPEREWRGKRPGRYRPSDECGRRLAGGLVHFDALEELRGDAAAGFVDSRLGVAAAHVLGEPCEDLEPSTIAALVRAGGAAGRARLAAHCVRNASLVLRIAHRRGALLNALALCRETGVPLSLIQYGGSTVRGEALLGRYGRARSEGRPPVLVERSLASLAGGGRGDEGGDEKGDVNGGDGSYDGAHVIPPMIGRYTSPVVTLDYSSLYPSCMRSYGLCPSLYVGAGAVFEADAAGRRCVRAARAGREVLCSEDQHVFCAAGERIHVFRRDPDETRGVVPALVSTLVASRAAVRARAAELDPSSPQARVLGALQLAIKVVANSIYGIFGCRGGPLASRPVAESTTACGREALRTAMSCVQRAYPDAEVLYGDTDSIFVHFAEAIAVEEALRRAATIQRLVNETHRGAGCPRLYIEVEKAFRPFLIARKKGYAGVKYVCGPGGGAVEERGVAITGFDAVKRSASHASALLQRGVIGALLGAGDAVHALREALEETAYRVWRALGGYYSLADLQVPVKNNGAAFSIDAATGGRVLERYSSEALPIFHLMERMDARVNGSAPGPGGYAYSVTLDAVNGEKVGKRGEEPLHLVRGAGEPALDRQEYATRLATDACAVLRCVLLDLGDPYHDRLDVAESVAAATACGGEWAHERPAKRACGPARGGAGSGSEAIDVDGDDGPDYNGCRSAPASASTITESRIASERKRKTNRLAGGILEYVQAAAPRDLRVRIRSNGGRGSWMRMESEDVIDETYDRDGGEEVVGLSAAARPALFERFRSRLEMEARETLRAAWAADAMAIGATVPRCGPIPLDEEQRRRILFELHSGGENRNFLHRPAYQGILRHLLDGVPLRTTLPRETEWDGGAELVRMGILSDP
eukprot:tig00020539_g10399.t1